MPESRRRRRRGRPVVSNRGAGVPGATTRPRPRRNSWLYIVASAVIALLVIAGFAVGGLAGIGGGGNTQGSSNAYVPGVGDEHETMLTVRHIPESQTVEYNTVPGTSGDHWARWSECGFFEEELPDERVVHNLEHGNIVVSYNLTDEVQISELRDVFDDIGLSNIHGVARAYQKITKGSVALAAWGVTDEMTGVDQERIKTFFETYAGRLGPEGNISCLNSGVMP